MIAKADKPLTAKQSSFVQYYADPASETFNNATQSAIKAGYEGKWTASNAKQITNNNQVKAAIEQCKAKIAKIMDVTRNEVIDNARYLINMGKELRNGSDIGKGNEQLGKIASVFTENINDNRDEKPVLSLEQQEMASKIAKELTKPRLSKGTG